MPKLLAASLFILAFSGACEANNLSSSGDGEPRAGEPRAGVWPNAPNDPGEDPAGEPPADDCRNGTIDPGEDCDGADLDGATCEGLGYAGGSLTCAADCRFETNLCEHDGTPVDIDLSAKRQQIEGFGFFGPMQSWWFSDNPQDFYSDEWLDLVLTDLGLTIWRDQYYSEESNQDSNWAEQRPMVKALDAKAKERGVPLKIINTVWSPPSQWKSNGSLKHGGHLMSQHYEDFGHWLVDGIDQYAAEGIELYGISPQNEPLFSQFFNSCEYTIDEYREMMKVVGAIVHEAYPNVKIFGPEHMLFGAGIEWDWNYLDPSQATLNDPESGKHVDIWACHGYASDGATPNASSVEAQYWKNAKARIEPFNKQRWMTETSGRSGDWTGSIGYAMAIHAALLYGEVSAWVHWYGADHLVNPTSLTKKGYAARHYFRFVRPGARAVTATVQDDELLVTAFEHERDGTVTVVLINSANDSKQVSLRGTSLPSTFTAHRTSASENGVNLGSVMSSDVTIPAKSIVTLHHE